MSTIECVSTRAQDGLAILTWSGLTGGDVGGVSPWPNLADKTVHVFGTIGATITIEGSNDPLALDDPDNASWIVLTNNFAASLAFDEAGMALIAEAPLYIRPNAAAGDTDATVIIVANAS